METSSMAKPSKTSRLQCFAWNDIDTAPKDGTYIWLTDGFLMRIGYWYVVTKDPTQEHWADMAMAEAHQASDLNFKPTQWMALPKSPNRISAA